MEVRFLPYRRPFRRPLRAAWGVWKVREGYLLRLTDPDTGRHAYGEIAPLPEFGTENQRAAGRFLAGLPSEAGPGDFEKMIAMAPPACAFGLRTALQSLQSGPSAPPAVHSAAIVDTETSIAELRRKGHRRFKVKLGLGERDREWKSIQNFILQLEENEKLRLDPNRGWKEASWDFWKPRLHGVAGFVEFIEEPFDFDRIPVARLLEEARRSPVPLALDESLTAGRVGDWINRGWPGYYIIKPALAGDPAIWLPRLLEHRDRVVLSSAFETGIGLSAIVRAAASLPGSDHGLGTQDCFEDDLGPSPRLGMVHALQPEREDAVWFRVSVS